MVLVSYFLGELHHKIVHGRGFSAQGLLLFQKGDVPLPAADNPGDGTSIPTTQSGLCVILQYSNMLGTPCQSSSWTTLSPNMVNVATALCMCVFVCIYEYKTVLLF